MDDYKWSYVIIHFWNQAIPSLCSLIPTFFFILWFVFIIADSN